MSDQTTETIDLEDKLENITEEELNQYSNFDEFLEAQEQPSEPKQETETETDTTTETVESTEPEETTEQDSALSDEEFRKAVTSTFRANHQDVQVDNPEDIRKLMQYGMNYHKKMAELAPHRKILKALEQNNLLDPSKINFTIDLLSGDKAAIAKFLKDQQVDTYELPDLEETPYKENDYLPTDARITFDDKIRELNGSVHGAKVRSYIQGLDSDSFHEVYTNPIIIDNLVKHAESGLLDDAFSLIAKEEALGNVPANAKPIDVLGYVCEHLATTNPSKYGINVPQQKVLGNSKQTQQTQPTNTNHAKASASIPTNTSQASTTQSGIDLLINATEADLAKYSNWEEFLASNNLNF